MKTTTRHSPSTWQYITRTLVGAEHEVEIRPTPLNARIAGFWHLNIQPEIRRQSVVRYRADERWNWLTLLTLALSGAMQKKTCWGLALMVHAANGRMVPAALSLQIDGLAPKELDQRRRTLQQHDKHAYLWFMATAPREALLRAGVPHPPRLGRIAVDSAMVASEQAGFQGRIWLHASDCHGNSAAAARLYKFYEQDCKLCPLGSKAYRFTEAPVRRKNDGRHFRADEGLARVLYNGMRD